MISIINKSILRHRFEFPTRNSKNNKDQQRYLQAKGRVFATQLMEKPTM